MVNANYYENNIQVSVIWCPSYRELRVGKNLNDDLDLTTYLHDVMLIRNKLDIQK